MLVDQCCSFDRRADLRERRTLAPTNAAHRLAWQWGLSLDQCSSYIRATQTLSPEEYIYG